MKAVVAAFNQEKALVGAFSVITNLRMELFQALVKDDLFIREDVVHKYELGRHQELWYQSQYQYIFSGVFPLFKGIIVGINLACRGFIVQSIIVNV